MPKKGSNPTGIIILSVLLILTIGGFGYWNYTLQVNQVKSYYVEHTAAFTSSTEDTFHDIPDLSLTFNVGKGEIVYVSFTCTATLTAVSGVTLMHFIIKLDSVQITASEVVVGYSGTLPLTYAVYSVALQYEATSLVAGSHTIVIMTMRECNGNIINSNLLVQVN